MLNTINAMYFLRATEITEGTIVRNYHTIKAWRVSQKLSKSHLIPWVDFKGSLRFYCVKIPHDSPLRKMRCTEEVHFI